MKKLFLVLLCLTSFTVFANRESGGRRASAAFFIKFTSPGNGIDHKTFSLAEQLIIEAEDNDFVKEKTQTRWGREGEVTICILFQGGSFDGVGPSTDFIKMLAPLIIEDTLKQGLTRTLVFSSFSCKDITQATLQNIHSYLD